MDEDLDRLLAAQALTPPGGFAERVVALARVTPQQAPAPSPLRLWRWLWLCASAGVGSLLVGEYALFAFFAANAH